MGITIRKRKPNGHVVIRLTATANTVAGGIKLNDPIIGANATSDEVVQSMSIDKIFWSSRHGSSNRWIIRRGSNNVMILHGNGDWDVLDDGMRIEEDLSQLTSNLHVELEGGSSGGGGTIVVKLHKVSGE